MFNNILGKKNAEIDSKELKELRQKFREVAGQNPEVKSVAIRQDVMVDPERFEENERITNLIMQQIKELIEIDNNLNIRIKDIETKIKSNISATSDIKNVVDKFHQRLEFIEKNMEKFIGLYEVVTNRYNPFIEQEDTHKATLDVDIPDVPSQSAVQKTQSKSVKPVQPEPQPAQKPVAPVQPEPAAAQNDDASKIISQAQISGKLDSEQINIVKDELKQMILHVGGKIDEQLQKTITQSLSKAVNKVVVESIQTHSKLTADQIKDAMESLVKAVQNATQQVPLTQPQPAQVQQNPQPTQVQQDPQPAQQPAPAMPLSQQATPPRQSEEVNTAYHFTLPDGTEIKSISDLKAAIAVMDDKTFASHVNKDSNDFASWVGLVRGDETLAEQLFGMQTKGELLEALEYITNNQ